MKFDTEKYKKKYGDEMLETNLAEYLPNPGGDWVKKTITIPEWKYYMIIDLLSEEIVANIDINEAL